MADDQSSSKSQHKDTGRFEEGSFNGVTIRPASVKETITTRKSDIRRRHESANTESRILREERSNASHTGGGRHSELEPNRGEAERQNINCTQNLDSSFLSVDERGNIVPKTPETALVAAQAYILTMQPAPGDPRESMHQTAIKGLGLI
jgi:hypothetical protein